jgi:hypothetical protein
MSEFFRGWRRKVGVVTLVMACVVGTGWVRSFTIQDTVDFPHWSHDRIDYSIASDNNLIRWQIVKRGGTYSSPPSDKWFRWNSVVPRTASTQVFDDIKEQRFCGFGRRYEEIDLGFSTHTRTQYFIPYWSLVVPLTALSAYLIIWQPKSKESHHA